ncbi:hypothetical protein BGZ90_002008, partial [Linnemannia elongata]
DLEEALDAIKQLHRLACSTKSTVLTNFYSMKHIYHDLPLSLVEDILGRRDDMDRLGIKEVMDPIKEKLKDKNTIDATRLSTIFSKVRQ